MKEIRVDENNLQTWIDVDVRMPKPKQLVKVKVADYVDDYTTNGYWNDQYLMWFSEENFCLNDLVYAWKSL